MPALVGRWRRTQSDKPLIQRPWEVKVEVQVKVKVEVALQAWEGD